MLNVWLGSGFSSYSSREPQRRVFLIEVKMARAPAG